MRTLILAALAAIATRAAVPPAETVGAAIERAAVERAAGDAEELSGEASGAVKSWVQRLGGARNPFAPKAAEEEPPVAADEPPVAATEAPEAALPAEDEEDAPTKSRAVEGARAAYRVARALLRAACATVVARRGGNRTAPSRCREFCARRTRPRQKF